MGHLSFYNKNQIRDKLLLVLIFAAGEVIEWQGYGIGSEREYTYSRRFGWMKIRRLTGMRENSFGQGLAIFFVIIGILYVIASIGEASEPKCIKAGCDNKQASGSSYCYLHKPYTGSSTSHSGSSYSNKSSSSTSKSSTSSSGSSSSYNNKSNSTNKSSYSSGTKKSTTTKKSTYDSYDDGYDDIYMDGDYDYDRYDRDSDYADGVDDAMDEYGEDW